MIVLDASAAVELLLHTLTGARIAKRVAEAGSIHCPHLADVEIANTLRHLTARGEVTPERATTALNHWCSLDIQRYAHQPFLDRVWALRENFSAYDAVYIALAEILESPMVTGDKRLGRAPGTRVQIEVFA